MRAGNISAALVCVTTLFFTWGFITSNNDPLIASLKASFQLNYTEALMTQLVSFAAYGIVSLPAAVLLNRLGALNAIMIALATMACGCVMLIILARYQNYALILLALFVLGAGITTLQVAANPLAAALGSPETSHFRLTFSQAFNSLGVVVGVSFGSWFMLREDVIRRDHAPLVDSAQRALALNGVIHAFGFIALLLCAMMAFTWLSRKYINSSNTVREVISSPLAALRSRWAVFGALAIGLYVGAEVSIGSVMINFLSRPDVLNVPLETAGFYLAYIYWMGALVGRFVGSLLLMRINAPILLGCAAAAAALLCLTVVASVGPASGYAALAVGFFNSIMFPTIFSITLQRAGVAQSSTSGLLCLAIVGGASLPYAVGMIADHINLFIAFIVPMSAYVLIALFALLAAKARRAASST